MSLLIGRRAELAPDVYDAMCVYRYKMFVRRLGWDLSLKREGHEEDQFDTDDALYIVGVSNNAVIFGCARLLPTTRPYLLGSVFRNLLDAPPPASATVWELSRFAVTPPKLHADGPSQGFARMVFLRAIYAARERGAEEVVGVVATSMERICRRFGMPIRRMSAPQRHGRETVVACSVGLGALSDSSGRSLPARKPPPLLDSLA